MTRRSQTFAAAAGMGMLALVALGGCVDEKIVYRDGPNYAPPPQAAASFVGYSDEASKATVCGSCHVGQQAKWKQTAHADAFATLEKSGSMQGYCQACHTVNDRGNALSDTLAGWRTTKDKRYHDVQCESCHGAGLAHIQQPTRGQMLPSIAADTGTKAVNGCAECHSGTHHPYVDEWRQTRHARVYSATFSSGVANPACQSCHMGQKTLEAWGVNTNYVEKAATVTPANAIGTTCVVCHDPHGSNNPKQLRYPIDTRDLGNNLCMKCHYRNSTPDFTSSRLSPHSPQGPMLLGEAGWWPPGLQVDSALVATHGTDRNPKLCATCHVTRFDVTDKATGKFVQTVTGHRFSAIPCVDSNGLPLPPDKQNCAISTRSYKSCAASGCHSEATARTVYVTAQADIAGLAAGLNSMLAKVPASEMAVPKVNSARGATFNVALALDKGSAAHNPFLAKALLRASIVAIAKDYGITPPPGLQLAPYDRQLRARTAN